LLIASYLASYNPPRFDVRYFAKVGDEKKKRKRGIQKLASDKTGGKVNGTSDLLMNMIIAVDLMLCYR
jgi:hypothetical protein